MVFDDEHVFYGISTIFELQIHFLVLYEVIQFLTSLLSKRVG